jgi:hypothetical protein
MGIFRKGKLVKEKGVWVVMVNIGISIRSIRLCPHHSIDWNKFKEGDIVSYNEYCAFSGDYNWMNHYRAKIIETGPPFINVVKY